MPQYWEVELVIIPYWKLVIIQYWDPATTQHWEPMITHCWEIVIIQYLGPRDYAILGIQGYRTNPRKQNIRVERGGGTPLGNMRYEPRVPLY